MSSLNKVPRGGQSVELWERVTRPLQSRSVPRIISQLQLARRSPVPEVPLDTFLTALHRPRHTIARDKPRLVVSARPQPFVAPKLAISGPEAFAAEIIFVEASAAVGKSTIARYLSSERNIPILDLARIPVSTGSLGVASQIQAAFRKPLRQIICSFN
jgi:hypothetical protein